MSKIPMSDQETVMEQSLLGLIWNRKDDTLSIQLKAFEGGTKRDLAQFTAKKGRDTEEKLKKQTFPQQALSRQSSMQLHLFVDAPQPSYAAVIYAKDGNKTNIIFCKTSIMPVKKFVAAQQEVTTKLTIPRAELMAVLIGKRALDFVTQEMRVEKYTCCAWSDSKCVLEWLATKNVDKLSRFEKNRVEEI
ncbi:unnamed protein product [Enterobius vermicularis]|uniref:RNase H domain-containing protein n=1 Tax=Enterobius vermicularis TaxID=51028 RepID=A0A0N4V618_ENTVE|nr:unnamed protein product [Enterobius vermicularis]